MNDIMPPAGTKLPTKAPRNPRAKTAKERLASIGFDPIIELVNSHNQLKEEAEMQEGIRDGSLVIIRADNQKARPYNSEHHLRAIEGKVKIATTLAEYSDKKASQETDNDKPTIPFQINVMAAK